MGNECHNENIDIKSIRMRLKVSQHEFAEALGLSQETIKSWEQGRRNPTGLAKKASSLWIKILSFIIGLSSIDLCFARYLFTCKWCRRARL